MFQIKPLRTHEVLDEHLPAFLTADRQRLELAFPFLDVIASIHDESHLAADESLQGAFLVGGELIIMFLQQNLVGFLLA